MSDGSNTGKSWEEMTAAERSIFVAVLDEDLPRTQEEWLEFAVKLDSIEYDRRREIIAKRLEIRVCTFGRGGRQTKTEGRIRRQY